MNQRVGVVSVPWVGVPPKGQGSIAAKTHRITDDLAERFDFTVVGGVTGRDPSRENDRIDYVTVDERVDRYLDRATGMVASALRHGRHEYDARWYHPVYAHRAARAMRASRCSTVVVHEFPQWIPALKRANPDARVVLWGGADSFVEVDALLPYVRMADALIGASKWLVARFAERVPELAPRSYTVYSGVDTDRFRPCPERVVPGRIVYAGRLTPEKGLHVLVDAFRELADGRPDLELVLAGPSWVTPPAMLHGVPAAHLGEVRSLANDGYESELLRRAGPHAGRMRLVGALGGDALVELLQSADVFCHPGLVEEGFGAVIAEALACGAPVVVSDRGAPPEFIGAPYSGRIARSGDVAALTTALADVVDDPRTRAALAEHARATALTTLATRQCAEAFATVLDAVGSA